MAMSESRMQMHRLHFPPRMRQTEPDWLSFVRVCVTCQMRDAARRFFAINGVLSRTPDWLKQGREHVSLLGQKNDAIIDSRFSD